MHISRFCVCGVGVGVCARGEYNLGTPQY